MIIEDLIMMLKIELELIDIKGGTNQWLTQ